MCKIKRNFGKHTFIVQERGKMNIRKISVKEFKKRRLERSYISVYIVIKPITIENEAEIELKNLCVIYGFTELGFRRVMAIYFENTKDNRFWLGVFEDLKARNIKNIMFLVTPQNRNIERCAKIIYNDIEIIRSPEDIMGTINKYFATKTSRTLEIQLKNLILAEDIEKYKSNEKLIRKLNSVIEHIFNIFEYPAEIRKIIYTTNPIESLNSSLRKVTRGKGSFISKEAILKVLYLRIKDLEKSWSKRTKNWENAKHQLIGLYGERVLKYIQ